MAVRQREKEVARGRLGRLVAGSDAGPAGDRGGDRPVQRRARARRSRSTRCTSCSSRRRTGWPTGARPRTRSTTAGSSTSTRSPGCGSRTRASSRRPTGCWRRCSPRARCRASGSTIPTACSIRRGTSRCCRISPRGPGTSHANRSASGRPRSAALRARREDSLGPGAAAARWAVHGTTGYNYLNDLNGLYVDGGQARQLRRAYAKLTGRSEPFDDVLYRSKRLIIETAMASELTVLTHMLDRIAASSRQSRDFTRDSLRDVITEVVACFPVYRTYVDEEGWTPEDRAVVERAIARARRRNPAMESSLFDFFREVMLPRDVESGPLPNDRRGGYPPASQDDARERLRFAMKLQQYTGPVQAKGLEDTAFYRYNVLLTINEVGGDPGRFGRSVAEFHEAIARSGCATGRSSMLATVDARHQARRGRARPHQRDLRAVRPNGRARSAAGCGSTTRTGRLIEGEPAPDRNDEYRFYQALLGCWPLDDAPAPTPGRRPCGAPAGVHAEGGPRSQGAHELADPEPALRGRAEGLRRARARPAGATTASFPAVAALAAAGRRDRHGELAVAGRREARLARRARLLSGHRAVGSQPRRSRQPAAGGLRPAPRRCWTRSIACWRSCPTQRRPRLAEMLRDWTDGRIKLLTTAAGLRLRRHDPELFLSGAYVPLATEMTVDGNAIAFATDPRGSRDAVRRRRGCARACSGRDLQPPLGEAWKTSRVLLLPKLGRPNVPSRADRR